MGGGAGFLASFIVTCILGVDFRNELTWKLVLAGAVKGVTSTIGDLAVVTMVFKARWLALKWSRSDAFGEMYGLPLVQRKDITAYDPVTGDKHSLSPHHGIYPYPLDVSSVGVKEDSRTQKMPNHRAGAGRKLVVESREPCGFG